MNKENKTPLIRFKGFSDDWEQRKLGDYLEVSKDKNKYEVFDKEDVLSVSGDYGIVNQIKFQGRSFAGASVANYGVVEKGDVVYTKSPLKSNPYGIIKTNKGKPGIVSTLYAVYKPRNNMYSEFVQIYFEQDARMNNYMHPLVNKGAKNDMKVSDENALKGEVCFPNREEQIKISEYFQSLDNLITLHQRKCESLKKVKKSMLQKMFPKNGESVPEIRFAGFTDDWEQRKLGELGSCQSGIGFPDSEQSGKEGIPFFKVSDMNINGNEYELKYSNNYVTDEQIKRRKWKPITDVPAMFFAKVGAAVMLNRKRLINIPFLLDNNTMAYKFGDGWDTNFGRALFDTINLASLVQVGALPSYNASDVEDIEISMPSLYEQQKIGSYFQSLDNLITLHQRKVEKLKNLKKSMLQKMFV